MANFRLVDGDLLVSIFNRLSVLALRPVLSRLCDIAGVSALGGGTDQALDLLNRYLTDQSQRLPRALNRANERAWQALEIALAGDSWWSRCRLMLAQGDAKAFRQQVQAFLDGAPLPDLQNKVHFRQQCLAELQEARKVGLLNHDGLDFSEIVHQSGGFLRFTDPAALVNAEWKAVEELADDIKRAGYSSLAWFLALRPNQEASLLVVALRYFFHREIETDQQLFQGVAFTHLERLAERQEAGFAALAEAFSHHGAELRHLLGDVREVVAETRDVVLDLEAEQRRQGVQNRELYEEVLRLTRRLDLLHRELRPRDSLSIHSDTEIQLVKQLLNRYRAIPDAQRQRLPALLNALAKLEVAAGDPEGAQRDFQDVANLVSDKAAQAEAFFNAYQAALERRTWDDALHHLLEASALAPGRFEPFPLAKYEPQRILGAGGFGVAFLCRHSHSGSLVVIKALRTEDLSQDLAQVFSEARILETLSHSAIIRTRDCDYADPLTKFRPYLVLDYFEGHTLEGYVRERGPFSPEEWFPLARSMAEGLQAAHRAGILHRDIKPANVLILKGELGWQVKLIDFGLATRQSIVRATLAHSGGGSRSRLGRSIAGTLDYAAPEQLGKLEGVTTGPASDIYGFGKTCYYALTGTPEPDDEEKQRLPDSWIKLLSSCTARVVTRRPTSLEEVLGLLSVESDVMPSIAAPVQTAGAENRQGTDGITSAHSEIALSCTVNRCVFLSVCGRRAVFERCPGLLLVDLESGQTLKTLDRYWIIAVSPGNEWALAKQSLDSEAIHLLDLKEFASKGEIALPDTHFGWGRGAELSPDGKRVLTCDRGVRLWDVRKGGQVRRFGWWWGRGHKYSANQLIFSPDGQFALSTTHTSAYLWDVQSGRKRHRFGSRVNWSEADAIGRVAFSSDSRLVLSWTRETIRVWDVATGELLRTVRPETGDVQMAAFACDDKRIIAWMGAQVALWDLDGQGVVFLEMLLSRFCSTRSLAMTQDGRTILELGRRTVARQWDTETGSEMDRLVPGNRYFAVLSPEGSHAVATPQLQSIRHWYLAKNQVEEVECALSEQVETVAISPNGREVVTGGEIPPLLSYIPYLGGMLRRTCLDLWDTTTGTRLRKLGNRWFGVQYERVLSARFSVRGDRVVTCGWRDVVVTEVETGRMLKRLRGNQGCLCPDGTHVLVSRIKEKGRKSELRLWNLDARKNEVQLSIEGPDVTALALSPHAQHAASGHSDGTVRLWNLTDGTLLRTVQGHQAAVQHLCFTPAGHRFLSAGVSGGIRLWSTQTGEQLHQVGDTDTTITSVSFSKDGRQVIALQLEDVYRVWRLSDSRGKLEQIPISPPVQPVERGTMKQEDDQHEVLRGLKWAKACGMTGLELGSLCGGVAGTVASVIMTVVIYGVFGGHDGQQWIGLGVTKSLIAHAILLGMLFGFVMGVGVISGCITGACTGLLTAFANKDSHKRPARLPRITSPAGLYAATFQKDRLFPQGWIIGSAFVASCVAISLLPCRLSLPGAYSYRGSSFAERGDHARAIADFSTAIKMNSNCLGTHYHRGLSYQKLKKYDNAVADYSAVIRLGSSGVALSGLYLTRAYFHRGNTYLELGKLELAITDYSEAIRLDSEHASAYFKRGYCHGRKNDIDKAIADYTEAIRLDPKLAAAYYNRSLHYTEKGDRAKGKADMENARQLDPNVGKDR